MPASRPRVSKWGTYYGKNYQWWRKSAEKFLLEVPHSIPPIEGPVSILTEIVSPRPKSTKRTYPVGDNDNFEKAAWDALSRSCRFWVDDDQVVFNSTAKRYARPEEDPGVHLYISPMEQTHA